MMKNKIFLLSVAVLSLFAACSDDDISATLSINGAPTITSPASGTSYDFDEAAAGDPVDNFTWTAADFGFQSATTYKLEMDKSGNGFANPSTLATTTELGTQTLSIEKVNTTMIGTFGITDTLSPTTMEFRVCASISTEVETLCSGPISLSILPYPVIVKYDSLSVPGSYQGWDPSSRENVVFSRKNNEVYSGYIYFTEDNAVYKFVKGWSWDMNWGDIQPGDGVLDAGGIGNDIPIQDLGMYYLVCDLNNLTHSSAKTDWGVFGDATPTGWDADTDLVWDADRRVLTTTLDLSAGSIRFRANDDSANNFGDTNNNGKLDVDGEDIPISAAGNYTIDLILTVGDYTYTLKKN